MSKPSVGFQVASGARVRWQCIASELKMRDAMTPEAAADDEFYHETLRLHAYTVLARPETGGGLVERRVFGDPEVEAARTEALASPDRIEYIQRRAKEIRAERAAERKQPTPATSNRPGSHAAVAAVFNAMEEAVGRTMTPDERNELSAWIGSHMATSEPQALPEANPEEAK